MKRLRKSLAFGTPLLVLLFSALMLIIFFGGLSQGLRAESEARSLKGSRERNRPFSLDYQTDVSTCEQTENLVPDPGFEEDSGQPDSWHEQGDCLFEYDGPGPDSETSARIRPIGTEECKLRSLTGEISVEPGRFYDFSAQMKADLAKRKGEAYLRIRFQGGPPDWEGKGSAYTKPVTDTQGDWVKMTGSVQVPPDAEYARVEATLADSSVGSVWFDDIFLGLATCLDINKSDDPDLVEPGEMLTYTIAYSNTGREKATDVEVIETYDKNVTFHWADPEPRTGTTTVWDVPDPESSELPAGVNGAITVVVTVSHDTGDSNWLFNNFQIRSDETKQNPVFGTTPTFCDGDGCDINPYIPDAEKSGVPGNSTDYTLVLENKGACEGQADLTTNSSRGWGVIMSPPPPYVLPSGDSQTVTVSLAVPQCELSGREDVTLITTTLSCGPPCSKTVTNAARITTTVARQVDVVIERDTSKPPPTTGSALIFTHTVTNTGNWTDTVTLSDDFPGGITVMIEPLQFEDLGPCQPKPITVTVGNLTEDTELTGIIRATCMSDPSNFDEVIDEIKKPGLYLPIIGKLYCYCAPNEVANSCFVSPCAFASWWGEDGELNRQVMTADQDTYNPFDSCAARLGDPAYDKKDVPRGRATIYQTVTVPDTPSPELEFVYAMYSYDIMRGKSGILYDSFEIAIDDPNNAIFRTGNPEKSCPSSCRSEVWQSGIRSESVNLEDYKGKTITLYLSVWNREDHICNTWAYVDSVRIVP